MPSPTARWPTTASTGVDNTWMATVLAGVIGIAATFVVCAVVVFLVRRNRRRATPATSTTG